MIKNFWITGDTHGVIAPRLDVLLCEDNFVPEENALIILGDAGLNYYLGKKDQRNKREVEAKGVYIYCVRGNHEARPSAKLGMHEIHDDNVGGIVWIEDEFPHIRYFCDWGHYTINGLRTLVVGGAYSIDKYYRLAQGWKWFEDEQLAPFEMAACLKNAKLQRFDLVLSHTCPYSWRPTDLFLRGIDQSKVDNSMELWMEELKEAMDWGIWLYGHYHADRIERPRVEIFYTEIEALNHITERWGRYKETGELDWWLPLSPQMRQIAKG